MGMMYAVVQFLPYTILESVLLAIAIIGYKRTRANGALLIAVAAGMQILYGVFGAWSMWSLMMGGPGNYSMVALRTSVQGVGHLIAGVLIVVGVALLLRRLPQRRPAPGSTGAGDRPA
jgi:hypothetical protein